MSSPSTYLSIIQMSSPTFSSITLDRFAYTLHHFLGGLALVYTAKAVGWIEVPFGRDTGVVPSNIVLDRALVR